MRPTSKLRCWLDEAAQLAKSHAMRFALNVAQHTFGLIEPTEPKKPLSPEEAIEQLLRLRAPRRLGLHRRGHRAHLKAKRHELFHELKPFRGVPATKHSPGESALMNRATRRAIAGLLQFAPPVLSPRVTKSAVAT